MRTLTGAAYPSVRDSLTKAVEGHPKGLKEAFGIGELSPVEQHLSGDVVSRIVPMGPTAVATAR
jgi:hypothetical protein